MSRLGLVCVLAALLLGGRAQAQDEAVDRVETILAGMSLEQKIGQMFLVGLYGPILTYDGADFLREVQPGGIVVFNYNLNTPESLTQLVNDWQQTITEAGGQPMLVAIDQEGGRINTLEASPFTQFPAPMLLTATGNHALAYRVGQAQSAELSAVGIHMNLAPVADLETNPDNPVIFRRAYGSDPYVVAPAISAVVQGMRDANMMATLKHFPGHGETNEDSHTELPSLPFTMAELEQIELLPFQAGIDAGASAVMLGHLALPGIDPIADRPASLSPVIVSQVLRRAMGFEGIVMTDALDMDAIDLNYTLPEAVVLAVEAGVDMLTTGPHMGVQTRQQAYEALVAAVESGRISEGRIDTSVRRILTAKVDYGVIDWEPLDPATTLERIAAADSATLLDEMFTSGVTLIYDTADVLPLPQDATVAVAYPYHRLGVLRACEAANPAMIAVGFSNYPTPGERAAIAQVAQGVDHIVVFTQNAINKPEQAALVDALPPEKTVVVAYWSPYDLNAFARRPAAYLAAYSPNDEGFDASCDVLFGLTAARGRLPVNLAPDLLAASGLGTSRR